MDIAVLGMGRMGQAVAHRLLDGGHRVVVWNRSKGKAHELVAAGASEAATIAEAVAAAEIVLSSLANDDAVRAIALGDGGVRSSIPPDAVYVDVSTVSPQLGAELAEAFPHFVAMPILGSPDMVRAGRATYLAGGDPAAVQRLDPLFPTLTETVRRYDRAAKAASAKLASNLLLLSAVASLVEAFTVGRVGGLTDDQLRELLAASPIVAGVRNRFEGVLTGEQEAWWTTTLGAKDAGLAVDIAGAVGVDLPVTSVVADLYSEMSSRGHADEDIVAVRLRYPHPGGHA